MPHRNWNYAPKLRSKGGEGHSKGAQSLINRTASIMMVHQFLLEQRPGLNACHLLFLFKISTSLSTSAIIRVSYAGVGFRCKGLLNLCQAQRLLTTFFRRGSIVDLRALAYKACFVSKARVLTARGIVRRLVGNLSKRGMISISRISLSRSRIRRMKSSQRWTCLRTGCLPSISRQTR